MLSIQSFTQSCFAFELLKGFLAPRTEISADLPFYVYHPTLLGEAALIGENLLPAFAGEDGKYRFTTWGDIADSTELVILTEPEAEAMREIYAEQLALERDNRIVGPAFDALDDRFSRLADAFAQRAAQTHQRALAS